mmetsp:Transcript_24340/g.36776  ORF Transcript_24340/g.36776 Transcript_24340/m.36776 type:complete len:1632 (-) Transcript_24340:3-4898(-)|eukprot:CAMPEP_0194213744 /NCGR_PEP_ID=MMETSP0156-20130528/14542_1 /TAXON_ID=33649 /ORGANISM="Thalassionema nitzschioides, Strain L26-B" /LENGTH=1631 /DNA_ID=CAMNT_0038941849 /DNA_START=36 /DNA_END=4931 /DNA_ORIENTATION=+
MVVATQLLEGLVKRPSTASKVVEEALRRHESAKRIAQLSSKKIAASSGSPPRKRLRREEGCASSLSSAWQHWLFRALLQSPLLSVRQLSARILHSSAPPGRLRRVLMDLLSQGSSRGDLQAFGLIIQSLEDEDVVVLSGLKWASELLQKEAHENRRHRTWLLINWLYQLLFRSKYDLIYQKMLWTNSDLKTLANMISAYALLSRQPLRLEPVVKILGQLVDPAGRPKPKNTPTKAAPSNNESSVRNAIIEDAEMGDQPDTEEADEEGEDHEDEEDHDDDAEKQGVYDEDTDEGEEEGYVENEEDEDEEAEISENEDHQQDEELEEGEQEGQHDEDDDDEDGEDDDEEDEEHHDDDEEEENEDEDGMEVDEAGNDDGDQEITEAEQEIVDVVRHFEERLLDINDNRASEGTIETRPSSSGPNAAATTEASPDLENRKPAYIKATLQVMNEQHPTLGGKTKGGFLSASAEHQLWQSICNVVRPPKKPLNLKIFMRRAPTQEEFFRGSLTRNPVHLSHIAAAASLANTNEPTVRHLRQYIAEQLQMTESAELIELLCANNILNLDLKLRVIQQVLWKNHLMENSSSSVFSSLISGGGAPTFFATGSGLSMILSTERRISSSNNITSATPASALPPMVITYRLAGVDGEATEDMCETLNDPEAPSASTSPEEQERLMESEFGMTRLVTDGRGINVLLRSIQASIRDSLRRIRRDDVLWKRNRKVKRLEKNLSLVKFEKNPPFAGLILMKHCTKLPSNRKKLVDARAPTIMLRLLLDVLNAIDESFCGAKVDNSSTSDQNAQVVSNPTAVMLEELIETLASDISTDDDAIENELEVDQESSTLPLLLSSLETIYLGSQLRKVIAKLLPFLTYGHSSLARELAENFEKHIKVEKLSDCEAKEQPKTRRFVLMDTFVQAAVCLPPNAVCYSLRSELIKCGFVERLICFVLEDMPDQPPPWSAALWPKRDHTKTKGNTDVSDLEQSWKYYFLRSGIKTAIDMLVGICRGHKETQNLVANYGTDHRFLTVCHWMESTSDNKTVRIYLNGLGLLAETLLDEVKEKNTEVATIIGDIRRKTRERKKEIADERRSKALVAMSSRGPVAGSAQMQGRPYDSSMSGTIRSSFLAPVLGFFGQEESNSASKSNAAPAWLAEMEALEDETGLTCAVCQEGRTLQPSELLGLYCHVKKVSIPQNKCGGKSSIDGAMLLISLPESLPTSLVGTPIERQWYNAAKSTGETLRSSNSSGSNRKTYQVTTTVSAGNAIHCSCHSKARSADRNHPKAPKSEWEGAKLRNARVNCNIILPLVSSKSSKVPLMAVDMALTDYQSAIGNLLGARPKAMLWVVLNDIRLLLLRIAYGEALNVDCGGGSLSSNAALIFYQLLFADMFTNEAEHDSPQTARHTQSLSGGFLAARKILNADDYESCSRSSNLSRHVADAAPMAALTCILYHNTKDDDEEEVASEADKDSKAPHPKRRWEVNKEEFLCGLIACAGRRHALSVTDSGCLTSRNKGKRTTRASSFSDWEIVDDEHHDESDQQPKPPVARTATSVMGKRGLPNIDDFALALRPMITLYIILDAISSYYVQNMTDEMVEEASAFLVKRVEECQRAKSLPELLRKANFQLENFRILEELQKGMMAA